MGRPEQPLDFDDLPPREDVERDLQLDLFSELPRTPLRVRRTATPSNHEEPFMEPSPDDVVYVDKEQNIRSSLTNKPRVFVGGSGPVAPDGKRPIITGIYRHPARRREETVKPAQVAKSATAAHRPRSAETPSPIYTLATACGHRIFAALSAVKQWFTEAKMPRMGWIALLVAIGMVMVAAFFSAKPTAQEQNLLLAPLSEEEETLEDVPQTPVVEVAPPVMAEPVVETPAPVVKSVTLPNWNQPHTQAEKRGDHLYLQFDIPIFVSADNISVEGMQVVNVLAARLRVLKTPARVVITGHTDDEQIRNPSAKFQTNNELAAARAHQVREHLELKSRNKNLRFQEEAEPHDAPYPNDSAANRRLNRTVTIRLYPDH